MSESELKLTNAPIVEAVIDIDCDMPPGFELVALEQSASGAFRDEYPRFRTRFVERHRVEPRPDAPGKHQATREIQALQFWHDDEKQLVQVRATGFSFNRLAPYTSLDAYLPEMRRTWELFVQIASPVQIRVVRLRYINRIMLPLTRGRVDFKEYLRVGPKLPDEDRLRFASFFNQHTVVETETEHQATIVLASRPPDKDKLPIIFDISVAAEEPVAPENWTQIAAEIHSLRTLKNTIFQRTLRRKCRNLFQQ